MTNLEALTQVYSFMYPEVRSAVFNTIFPTLANAVSQNPNSTNLVSQIKADGDLVSMMERVFREDYLSQFLKTPQEMDVMHVLMKM